MFKNKKSTDFASQVESLSANKATSLTSPSAKDTNAGAKAPESFTAASAGELHGYVMKFNAKDGYGFVKGEDGVDYFFRIENFDGKGELPAPGRYVKFTVSKKARQMGKAPKIAAMRFDETKAGEAENTTEDDTRTRCPYCGKMMVPRVVINYGIPIKSICPFCFGTIHAVRFKKTPLITKKGLFNIFLLAMIIAAFWGIQNFIESSTFHSFLSDELDRELQTNQTFHDEYFSKTQRDFWVRLESEPDICSKVNVSPITCWELKQFNRR